MNYQSISHWGMHMIPMLNNWPEDFWFNDTLLTLEERAMVLDRRFVSGDVTYERRSLTTIKE